MIIQWYTAKFGHEQQSQHVGAHSLLKYYKYDCTMDQELLQLASDVTSARLASMQTADAAAADVIAAILNDSVNRCTFTCTWRTILPNFIPIRFETTEPIRPVLKTVAPTTTTTTTRTRWVAKWDQFLIQKYCQDPLYGMRGLHGVWKVELCCTEFWVTDKAAVLFVFDGDFRGCQQSIHVRFRTIFPRR